MCCAWWQLVTATGSCLWGQIVPVASCNGVMLHEFCCSLCKLSGWCVHAWCPASSQHAVSLLACVWGHVAGACAACMHIGFRPSVAISCSTITWQVSLTLVGNPKPAVRRC